MNDVKRSNAEERRARSAAAVAVAGVAARRDTLATFASGPASQNQPPSTATLLPLPFPPLRSPPCPAPIRC